MEQFFETFEKLSTDYSSLFIISSIIFLIWGIYNKIKFECLKKASEMVAAVEKYDDLTGQEKFSLCIIWIIQDLPKIFGSALFKSIVEKMIEFSYNNSHDYMKNYVKRKTNTNINELINQANQSKKEEKEDDFYSLEEDW